jgi:hypothetical protein
MRHFKNAMASRPKEEIVVQPPTNRCPLSDRLEGLGIGHDFCHRPGCPFEGISSVVPLFMYRTRILGHKFGLRFS